MVPCAAPPAIYQESPAECRGSLVTITTDHGGRTSEYINRREGWRRDGTKVEIVGTCESACTLYLGLPKGQVCVFPNAWLGFHAPRWPDGLEETEFTRLLLKITTGVMWGSYPANVQLKLGELTSDLKYLRGRDVIPAIPECKK